MNLGGHSQPAESRQAHHQALLASFARIQKPLGFLAGSETLMSAIRADSLLDSSSVEGILEQEPLPHCRREYFAHDRAGLANGRLGKHGVLLPALRNEPLAELDRTVGSDRRSIPIVY